MTTANGDHWYVFNFIFWPLTCSITCNKINHYTPFTLDWFDWMTLSKYLIVVIIIMKISLIVKMKMKKKLKQNKPYFYPVALSPWPALLAPLWQKNAASYFLAVQNSSIYRWPFHSLTHSLTQDFTNWHSKNN